MQKNLLELRARGAWMLGRLQDGTVDAYDVVETWRAIVDQETESNARTDALLNLATAMDHLGPDGRLQAKAIVDRALKDLKTTHPQKSAVYFMAAQRLMGKDGSDTPENLSQALRYLHSALVSPKTAGSDQIRIQILRLYATAVERLGDFSKVQKAERLFDRLRRERMEQRDVWITYAAMIELFHARWQKEAHRPSLGKAITLSAEALVLMKPEGTGVSKLELADFQQLYAILLMERHTHIGARCDFDKATDMYRLASTHGRSRPAALNSLAIHLLGSDAHPPSEEDMNEARLALDEGFDISDKGKTFQHLVWTDANWHLQAYRQGGKVDHLDRAVEAAEDAAQYHDILGVGVLFSVVHAHYARYVAGRDPQDIDRAIEYAERGLSISPEAGASRWSHELSAGNAYQERAIGGRFGFSEDDAKRAVDLQLSALERLPRNSDMKYETAATALGSLIEHYIATNDVRILASIERLAKMLPATPSSTAKLAAISAVNVAVYYLRIAQVDTDQAPWVDLLRDIASKHGTSEAGWNATANLMNFHLGKDWREVANSYGIIAKQRASRLSAAKTPQQRAMVLRREQRLASIAGLALTHLGEFSSAVDLINRSQAALLAKSDVPNAFEEAELWDSVDAVFYPVLTYHGCYVLSQTRGHTTGLPVPDVEIDASSTPGFPDNVNMEAASSLIKAAFGTSMPKNLMIIPSGELATLPWAAVKVGDRTLIDLAKISLLPSLNFWKRQIPSLPGQMLLVDAAGALPQKKLRHAEAEVDEILRLFPSSVKLDGPEATISEVIEATQASGIFHFAGHGEADIDDPLRSNLILSEEERLTIGDIFAADFSNLSLASLSACQTAFHGKSLPDEFSNVAVAFLAAGASAAIGTLWNVSDVSASLFSRRLFHELLGGAPVLTAARMAQLWLRDSTDSQKSQWLETLDSSKADAETWLLKQLKTTTGSTSFKDPKHWAAFVCFG